MKFIKTDQLKEGMRIAKPIYNKGGVLLYDRDTKLTTQGITSIKNFNLFGIYILEPTEPLPPTTIQEKEFEKFQVMAVYSLMEDLEMLLLDKQPKNLSKTTNLIVKNYGRPNSRINFIQTLRSNEDYLYKHLLNTAIMAAMMAVKLNVKGLDMQHLITAALIHDAGSLLMPIELIDKDEAKLSVEEKQKKRQFDIKGYNLIQDHPFIDTEVKAVLSHFKQLNNLKADDKYSVKRFPISAKILQIASEFDQKTAMKDDEEPDSDVAAVKHLLTNPEKYDENIVGSLLTSVKVLYPGRCVQLTTKETGLVIKENKENVLRPYVLVFESNKIYDLSDEEVHKSVHIDDVLKDMDKRIPIDQKTIEEYKRKYNLL